MGGGTRGAVGNGEELQRGGRKGWVMPPVVDSRAYAKLVVSHLAK
jgi:hypothetical protein